jgi:hypothetical protein
MSAMTNCGKWMGGGPTGYHMTRLIRERRELAEMPEAFAAWLAACRAGGSQGWRPTRA